MKSGIVGASSRVVRSTNLKSLARNMDHGPGRNNLPALLPRNLLFRKGTRQDGRLCLHRVKETKKVLQELL